MKGFGLLSLPLAVILGGCTSQSGQVKNPPSSPPNQEISVTEVKVASQPMAPELADRVRELFRQNNLDLADLVPARVEVDNLSFTHVRMDQTFAGRRVFQEEVIYHFDKSGKYYLLSGRKISSISAESQARITKEEAARVALRKIGAMKRREPLGEIDQAELAAELGYWGNQPGSSDEKDYLLVWKITPKNRNYPQVFVDAQNGSVVYEDSGIRY